MSGTPADVVAVGRDGAGRADLPGLRWLARHVLAPDCEDLVRGVPAPRLVSQGLGDPDLRGRRAVRDYISWWVQHPEQGGRFEARTRGLRWLPGSWLVRLLLAFDYDGLLYPRGGAVVGHVFFQRHGPALHGFSVAVDESAGLPGSSVVMMMDFVALAAETRGVTEVRVGTGGNATTRRLLERLRRREDELGWRVGLDGWVRFSRASTSPAAGPQRSSITSST